MGEAIATQCNELEELLTENNYTGVKVHPDGVHGSSNQVYVHVSESGVRSSTIGGYLDVVFGSGKWDMDFSNGARGADIRVGVASPALDAWSRRASRAFYLAAQGCATSLMFALAMLVASNEDSGSK